MSKPSPSKPLDREAKRRFAVIRHGEEVTGNVALSCRYFGISRQAYYTWHRRYQAAGIEGLRTLSRAPKTSPNATHIEVVGKIIYLRQDPTPSRPSVAPSRPSTGSATAGALSSLTTRAPITANPAPNATGAPRWDEQLTDQPGPVVGHATIGVSVAVTRATDSIGGVRDRDRGVVAELRAQVAEHETGVDGKLPMDHPMALWCDTVSNIASQIEYALRTPAPGRGIPCHDGPTVAECAADGARWPLEKEGE